MNHVVAIVGPTAVGKSDLAIRVAQELDAEIVNADSRQVYRYMDIGTSKPDLAERALVPHHIIDVVDPDEDFNLAAYLHLAHEAIAGIREQGRLTLLVGGTGLYIWSILEGWSLPRVPPDRRLRNELEARARTEGEHALHRELREIDSQAANRIHPRNVRRVIRALEVYRATRQPPSLLLWRSQQPDFAALVIGLALRRSELYGRIDRRIDSMMKLGLVEEVKGLLERGYGSSLPCMSGIGYKQIGQFLRGEKGIACAVEQMKFASHRMARHQHGWFRPSDKRIRWFDAGGGKVAQEVVDLCRSL